MTTDRFRHNRHKASQCVTCAGQFCRHERHTPLGGVTIVTLAKGGATTENPAFDLVPMPPFANGCVTARLTVPFSLPKKSGENAHG
jgi:hypothetical protein